MLLTYLWPLRRCTLAKLKRRPIRTLGRILRDTLASRRHVAGTRGTLGGRLRDTRSTLDLGSVRAVGALGRDTAGPVDNIALGALGLLERLADGATEPETLGAGGRPLVNALALGEDGPLVAGGRLPRDALAVAVLVAVTTLGRGAVEAMPPLAVGSWRARRAADDAGLAVEISADGAAFHAAGAGVGGGYDAVQVVLNRWSGSG